MNVWTAPSRLQRDRRQAFTIVELLVVIGIISVIASMTLFALNGVREDSRERRTRSQVTKIHEVLVQHWEGYRTRAVPVLTSTSGMDPRIASQFRLRALRELMRMELPDRKTDLLSPVSDNPSDVAGQTRYLRSSPTLWRAYVRRARHQVIGHNGLDPTAPASQVAWIDDVTGWTPEHQHAECLYLILASMRDGDTTGLDFISEDEIGDVDNDGMPEVLDPWGVPIYFLRWAPGFLSDLQPRDAEPGIDGNAGTGNGDPFDPLKWDPRWRDGVEDNDPYVLFPLVMSAGRDRLFDVLVDFNPPLDYDTPSPTVNLYNDPYVTFNDPVFGPVQIGYQDDIDGDNALSYADNITSHFLEVR